MSDIVGPPPGPKPRCAAPNVFCPHEGGVGGTCSNLTDDYNCGSCGNRCSGATPYCREGQCVRCPQLQCNDQCVDPRINSNHCGACGVACPSEAKDCYLGKCQACAEGMTACEDDCTNLKTDPDNCGRCGRACENDSVCRNGRCRKTHCYDQKQCRRMGKPERTVCGNGHRGGRPPPPDYQPPPPLACARTKDCPRPFGCVDGVCTPPCERCCRP